MSSQPLLHPSDTMSVVSTLLEMQAPCAKCLPHACKKTWSAILRQRSTVGCCSRAMAGVLSAGVLEARLDENGTDFLSAATAAGYGAGSTQVGGPCYFLKAKVWPCTH